MVLKLVPQVVDLNPILYFPNRTVSVKLRIFPPCEALNVSLAMLTWLLIMSTIVLISLSLILVAFLGIRLVTFDGRLRLSCEYFAQICVVYANVLVFLDFHIIELKVNALRN